MRFVLCLALAVGCVTTSGCGEEDLTCEMEKVRLCERACECGEPDSHCGLGEEAAADYESYPDQIACEQWHVTVKCSRDRKPNVTCYRALVDAICVQFSGGLHGLGVPEPCSSR